MRIKILGFPVNKANTYTIHINPSLWGLIKGIVEQWRRTHKQDRPWWIAPSPEAKAYQEEVAWRVKTEENRRWTDEQRLCLTIVIQGSKIDLDGVKAILDGIQDSGRITNDSQFERLVIQRVGGTPEVRLYIEEVELCQKDSPRSNENPKPTA